LDVLSRHHHDLRLPEALQLFSGVQIQFVFFLAYEVGGAKFLQLPEFQHQILDYNLKITDNVFAWLALRQIRFAFASSSLSADNSTYGFVKRMGENRTRALPHLGRIFRIWNAYGFEYPGPKSHAIPDFIFQCLLRGRIETLTDGKELRQFTHVDDLSDALIAIMEYFDEAPPDIDVSDGKWMKLADVARAVQRRIPGCELNLSASPAVAQKRHEANLTSEWHALRWRQKMSLEEGVDEIVERAKAFVNFSRSEPAVTIVIDCGDDFNETVAVNVARVVARIDVLSKPLAPMTIEIIAAARRLSVDNRTLPCTLLVNAGHARRKAVRIATAGTVLLTNPYTIPTIAHLSFFQRRIPRDLVFYFADRVLADGPEVAVGETNATIASFAIVTDCNRSYTVPQDLSFIAATKETWLSVHVPPYDVNVNDWLLRFAPGYIAVRFESPVWAWERPPAPQRQTGACCSGAVDFKKVVSGKSEIYDGERSRVV
jgi:nucleoside-diphosphate-sugar epimerase